MTDTITLSFKVFTFLLIATLWAIIGFAFWLLVALKVVSYVPLVIIAVILGRGKPISFKDLIERTATVYTDGFQHIYDSVFKEHDRFNTASEDLIPTSIYNFLLTAIIIYFFFAPLNPDLFVPDVAAWITAANACGVEVGCSFYKSAFFGLLLVNTAVLGYWLYAMYREEA